RWLVQLAFHVFVGGSTPARSPSFPSVSQAGSRSSSLGRMPHGPSASSRSVRRAQPVGRWFESNTAHHLSVGLAGWLNQFVVGSNPTRPTTCQSVSQAGSTSLSLVRIQHGPPPFSRSRRLAQPVCRWFESNTAHHLSVGLAGWLNQLVVGSNPTRPTTFQSV